MRTRGWLCLLSVTDILNIVLPMTTALPASVANIFKKIRMKVSVPKPSKQPSFRTILAGPDFRNLVIPNEPLIKDSKNVTTKRGPTSRTELFDFINALFCFVSSAHIRHNIIHICGTASRNGSETNTIEINII